MLSADSEQDGRRSLMAHTTNSDPWRFRRRFMLAVCAFCMWIVTYIIVFDKTGGAAETAVSMGFMTLASSLAAYVFGAAWETVKAPQQQYVPQYNPYYGAPPNVVTDQPVDK